VNEDTDAHWLRDASLPEYGPPDDIYRLAVPIWCGQSHDHLAGEIGPEYGCGFADGFQQGIVMAMHRPEWAQGFYLGLREYYLTTDSEEDLYSWELAADKLARAMPLRGRMVVTAPLNQPQDSDERPAVEDPDKPSTEQLRQYSPRRERPISLNAIRHMMQPHGAKAIGGDWLLD
jgi:hypothetical protein